MTDSKNIRITGYIMPVGNGAVGKTSVSRILDLISQGESPDPGILMNVQKTKNLEYEFVIAKQIFGNNEYNVSMQFLVPPGQKESEGDSLGRSFERVIEIYKETIRRVDVFLFTYDLSSRQSFQDLEFWVDAVGDLMNDATHFLLLGTHLDLLSEVEIYPEEILTGLEHIKNKILENHPTWVGKSAHLEISNLTGENLKLLLRYISGSIINSRKIMP